MVTADGSGTEPDVMSGYGIGGIPFAIGPNGMYAVLPEKVWSTTSG